MSAVWVVYLTRDGAWSLLDLAVDMDVAKQLAEEHAAPYVPFGQPRLRPARAALDWRVNSEDDFTGDVRADRWLARWEGEDFIIQPWEVRR